MPTNLQITIRIEIEVGIFLVPIVITLDADEETTGYTWEFGDDFTKDDFPDDDLAYVRQRVYNHLRDNGYIK